MPTTYDSRRCGRALHQLVAGVGIVLFALLTWYFLTRTDPSPSTTVHLDGASRPDATALDDAALVDTAGEAARAPVLLAVEAAPEVAEVEEPERDDTAGPTELRGRVVDEFDRPIAGAQVALLRGELRDFEVLSLELISASEQIAATVTDLAGEFRFDLERGALVDVQADAPGLCQALVPNCHAGDFVVVRMRAGYRVFGRVTRAGDRAPVVDAVVNAFQMGGSIALRRTAHTALDGSFDLRLPYNDRVYVEVVPIVEQCSTWIPVVFDERGEAPLDVVVEIGITVTGRVTSLQSGQPIAGATVGEGWIYRRTATTDADGRYRLDGFGAKGLSELFAKAPGFGEAQLEQLPGAVNGQMEVDFELPAARRAHGRVVDADGRPLAGVLAAAVASDDGPQGQRQDWLWSRTNADGYFEIERLTSDLRHALMLAKAGLETRVYEFPRNEASKPDLDLGTFELGQPAVVAGIVENEAGVALAGVTVVLAGNNADRFELAGGASPRRVAGDFYTNRRESLTNAEGRFAFGGVAAGTFEIKVERGSLSSESTTTVEVAAGVSVDDLVIVLPTGAGLRGRVVDPDGRPCPSARVRAELVTDGAVERDRSAKTHTTRADSNGVFELLGLEAREYRIEAMDPSYAGIERDAPLLSAVVERVATDGAPLTIVLPRGTTIRGTLHDAAGNALFGHRILHRSPQGVVNSCKTDAEGRFCLPVVAGGVVDIEVIAAGTNDPSTLLVERGIAGGTHGLVLVVP